jgi:hypothetical protein
MTLPNFLVIGAMKSGTTSLYHYLKQHPQIYMSSIKEPNFFALEGSDLDFNGAEGKEKIQRWVKRESVTSIDEYRTLFREAATSETAIGEASPMYLYSTQAPYRIKQYVPEAKLLTILRNPVERAYSAFLYMTRDGREPLDEFAEALDAEEARIRDNWEWIWHYRSTGFYSTQLERYFNTFDRDQIRIYLYEDLRSNLHGVLRDIFRFLEVDETFVSDTSLKHNVSGTPSRGLLPRLVFRRNPIKTALKPLLPLGLRRRLLVSLRSRYLNEAPPLAPRTRSELLEVYRDDILRLEGLIERDLSGWLK